MSTIDIISGIAVRHAVASRSGGVKFLSHSALAAAVIELAADAEAPPARIHTFVTSKPHPLDLQCLRGVLVALGMRLIKLSTRAWQYLDEVQACLNQFHLELQTQRH